MERVAGLHTDIQKEIIIKWNYKNILKRCKLLPQIYDDKHFWLKKAAWDLKLDSGDPELVKNFHLPELKVDLTSENFSPFQRYIRTLLYYGHISLDTEKFIDKAYLAKIALYANDLEAFKEFLKGMKSMSFTELHILGAIAMNLKAYKFVAEIMKYYEEPDWIIVFMHLAPHEEWAKVAIKNLANQEYVQILSDIYDIIMGKVTPTPGDFEGYVELILAYTARFRGFEAAEEIPGIHDYYNESTIYSILAGVAISLNDMDKFWKYFYLIDWNEDFRYCKSSLILTQNLDVFLVILEKMNSKVRIEFIRDLMRLIQSDNKIYAYIVKHFPHVTYDTLMFSVLQDLESYTYMIRHSKSLNITSTKLKQIPYEPTQILLREQARRSESNK